MSVFPGRIGQHTPGRIRNRPQGIRRQMRAEQAAVAAGLADAIPSLPAIWLRWQHRCRRQYTR